MTRSAPLARPYDHPSVGRVHSIDFALLGIDRTSPGARVLDLGCGAGRHELGTFDLPVQVAACDLDRASLRDGRFFVGEAAAAAAQSAPVAWLQASGHALPFRDAAFDAAICAETLEHVHDDAGMLRELRRAVRRGGRLAVSVPAYWPELLLWTISWRITHVPGGHIRIYRRGQLLERLRDCGWEPYAVRRRHALESVYWLLGAVTGGGEPPRWPARAWRHLVNRAPARLIDRVERRLATPLAKSIVIYATAI